MATIEEKFNAAVNVIKGLPKNGSYQPSNAMLLTFYGYFKQATEGPCNQSRPPFWDVVRRAKWDAWKAHGEMSKERAMELYVDELKKIIETMSYTDNVADFMGSISELDNVNFNDLEVVAPEIMKIARSHPNSPFASRGGSPHHPVNSQNGYVNGEIDTADTDDVLKEDKSSQKLHFNSMHQNGYVTGEQSDDEYIDTVEDETEIPSYKKPRILHHPNAVVSTLSRNDANLDVSRNPVASTAPTNIDTAVPALQQILGIVERMNSDLIAINQRMLVLERHVVELKNTEVSRRLTQRSNPEWWPFKTISPTWFLVLIIWPFVAQRLGVLLQKRKVSS